MARRRPYGWTAAGVLAWVALLGAPGPTSAQPADTRREGMLDDGTADRRAQTERADASPWRFRAAIFAGVLVAPREIGHGRNATGGEKLIALLGDGLSLGFEAGLETDAFGIGLTLVGGSNRVDVENELGVVFPNHGEAPWLWSWSVVLYPFFPLRAASLGRRLRPFVQLGIGGLLVSVDLDNVNDQSIHNSWQWAVGGGVRIFFEPGPDPDAGEPFLELRLDRHRVWRSGPLDGFDLWTPGIGLGMRI